MGSTQINNVAINTYLIELLLVQILLTVLLQSTVVYSCSKNDKLLHKNIRSTYMEMTPFSIYVVSFYFLVFLDRFISLISCA